MDDRRPVLVGATVGFVVGLWLLALLYSRGGLPASLSALAANVWQVGGAVVAGGVAGYVWRRGLRSPAVVLAALAGVALLWPAAPSVDAGTSWPSAFWLYFLLGGWPVALAVGLLVGGVETLAGRWRQPPAGRPE